MEKYSVLMSVYAKEKPEYLRERMESMFHQTVPTDDFVLVCDGPLTKELDAVITQMQQQYPDILHLIRLKKNVGLGNALKEGISYCKNELIARMDSDDISCLDRCKKQLAEFEKDPMLDLISGTIQEFDDNSQTVLRQRVLPTSHQQIIKFSKKRNPFNHPVVIFKKKAVIKAGNYNEKYPLFEDYYLWIRMLQNGCRGKNIIEPILYMRTSENTYMRRGGKVYAKNMLRFHFWMRKNDWSTWWDYLTGALPHAVICLLPHPLRKILYLNLRKTQ